LSRFRKTARVGADVTTCGRLFQRRLPATGKARSPTVMSRVWCVCLVPGSTWYTSHSYGTV